MDSTSDSRAAGCRVKGRIHLTLVLALAVLALGGGLILVSRHGRGLTPANPEPARAPIANTDGTKPSPPPRISGHAQPSRLADLATAKLIAQLLDGSLPATVRRQAARALTKLGSDQALAALKTILSGGPPYLQATIGEGLGGCPNPEAPALLLGLLDGPNEIAACGAIRGLARRGDAPAVDLLCNVLFDTQRPDSLRTEAALALGGLPQPDALSALARAAMEVQDPEIVGQIFEGLGQRPFSETEEFFGNYLDSPDAPVEFKVAALEALGSTEGDLAPFLMKYASDSTPEVRAAAIVALTQTDSTSLGPQLADLLKQETSPEVRATLYQALELQDTFDAATVLALAQKESDPGARMAGLDLLAQGCQEAPTPELLSYFNQVAVPELKNSALTGDDLGSRMASVMSLGRSGTDEAAGALQEIAQQSPDRQIRTAAQTALRVR